MTQPTAVAEEWMGLGGGVGSLTTNKSVARVAHATEGKSTVQYRTFASYEDYARMTEDGPEDSL